MTKWLVCAFGNLNPVQLGVSHLTSVFLSSPPQSFPVYRWKIKYDLLKLQEHISLIHQDLDSDMNQTCTPWCRIWLASTCLQAARLLSEPGAYRGLHWSSWSQIWRPKCWRIGVKKGACSPETMQTLHLPFFNSHTINFPKWCLDLARIFI